ncbi:MAG TPA: hypothetical protein VJN18_27655 [Polyangiaceae bacterium]|nr:hypothetical protein [Polyangiaceae bacterium]
MGEASARICVSCLGQEHLLQSSRAMPLHQFVRVSASLFLLLGACGSPLQAQRAPSPPAPATSDYVTIAPDESSYPARTAYQEPPPVDENEDIMASILAIPSGQ